MAIFRHLVTGDFGVLRCTLPVSIRRCSFTMSFRRNLIGGDRLDKNITSARRETHRRHSANCGTPW